jgi:YfiH family protein
MPEAVVLKSPLLESAGIPHAFSTRLGGVSSRVFASLNFGNPSDLSREQRDPAANIRQNYRLLLAAAGCPEREIVEVHQVHSAAVHFARRGQAAHASRSDTKADALITDDPARAAAVRIADCAPVLIAARDGTIVAAVHAGWRGVIAGVLPAAIDAMRAMGASDLVGAIGPCIGRDHFEVGPEVASEFRRHFGDDAPLRPGRADRSLVDLKDALRIQARRAGIEQVDVLPHCTFADSTRFFSHRRDRGITGRMAAIIGPRRP